MRILEALVAYYEDDTGLREQRINETDRGSGRNALHYLSYMANSNMIQLLAVTGYLKMNVLDKFDRSCLHYAAIHGKSTLINTLVLLFKQNGGRMTRAFVDPNYVEPTQTAKISGIQDEINQINHEIEKEGSSYKMEGGSEEDIDEDFEMSGDAMEEEEPIEEDMEGSSPERAEAMDEESHDGFEVHEASDRGDDNKENEQRLNIDTEQVQVEDHQSEVQSGGEEEEADEEVADPDMPLEEDN